MKEQRPHASFLMSLSAAFSQGSQMNPSSGGPSISFACQDAAQSKAAYRLFSNPRVNEWAILSGHTVDGKRALIKLSDQSCLAERLTYLARLVGYLARPHDPPPGNLVVWRCTRQLGDLTLGHYKLSN